MIISLQQKFIFIHIFKTGGTSITTLLRQHTTGQLDAFCDAPLQSHATAAVIQTLLGQELFNRLFSFAFVRNPWGLEYSLYNYMCKEPSHYRHEEILRMKNFEHYLKYSYYKYLENSGDSDSKTLGVQQRFVCDGEGVQLVNFIGRFENIRQDFEYVKEKIGLPEQLRLPHLNQSTDNDFRSHYNTKMIDWVGTMHRRDIDSFGYRFEP